MTTKSIATIPVQDFTPEQLKLITDTVARNATPEELQLFLYRCKNLGLDPLKPGKIHFVKYGGGAGSIVIGIEGFRQFAHQSGLLKGIKRGVLKDANGKLIGAWAEVYRKDWTECAREEVPLSEYNNGRALWKTMPETMIKKCAEAAALRMAFSENLGGVYIDEELEKQKTAITMQQPQEGDASGPGDGEYVVPYGPCAKQKISDCDPAKLKAFILEREEKYKASGRPHGAWFIELLKEAEPLIAEFENKSIEKEVNEDPEGFDKFNG